MCVFCGTVLTQKGQYLFVLSDLKNTFYIELLDGSKLTLLKVPCRIHCQVIVVSMEVGY